MSTPDYYAIKFTRASKKYLREALQIDLPYTPDKYVRGTVHIALDPLTVHLRLGSSRKPMKGTYEVVSLRKFKQIYFMHLLER